MPVGIVPEYITETRRVIPFLSRPILLSAAVITQRPDDVLC